MKEIILMTVLSFTLLSCDRQDKPENSPQDQGNTEKTISDKDSTKNTP